MQAGGRRFDPVQLHHQDLPIGCTLHSVQLWASAWSPKLKAVLFFNNSEGKGSSGLDESPGGHRVELYLAVIL